MEHKYFHTWSTNMAYILGYIMADGSIRHQDYCKTLGYSVVFNISLKDKSILEFMKKEIKTEASIIDRKVVLHNKEYNQCSLCISSKILITQLIDLGVIPNKTGHEIFPNNLPTEYQFDFMRGYFDGDGSIFVGKQTCRNKIYDQQLFKIVCANKNFLIEYQERLNLDNQRKISKYSDCNCYMLQIGSKKDILIIKKLFYENSSYDYALDRKKQKFYCINTKG